MIAMPSSRRRFSTSKTRVTSAAVSAEVASSRIRSLRIAGQRLGDLHHLAARQRQGRDRRGRVDVLGSGTGERFVGDAPLRGPVDEAPAARRIGDADIVGDAEMRHQRQFLENGGDAGIGRLAGLAKLTSWPSKQHAAGIGLDDARDDLDQGRLARPVLAEHGVDAARIAGEINPVQRLHAAETLGHSRHLQDRGGHIGLEGGGRM